jgi:UDP-glucose 4-epimerase
MAARQKVLITGGAGFIGSHTAIELCAAGFVPVVVDNFGASDRRIIQRAQELAQAEFPVHEIDAAHKAVGVSGREALAYYENNLGSLIALLEVMSEVSLANLVFSSSATVYGEADDLPVTEQSPVKPAESVYGRTKQMCELIISDTAASRIPLKAVTLR